MILGMAKDDSVGKKVDALTRKVNEPEGTTGTFAKTVNKLADTVASLTEAVDGLMRVVSSTNDRIDTLTDAVESATIKIDTLSEGLDSLTEKIEELSGTAHFMKDRMVTHEEPARVDLKLNNFIDQEVDMRKDLQVKVVKLEKRVFAK
jgi:chromosome segregation ATPase